VRMKDIYTAIFLPRHCKHIDEASNVFYNAIYGISRWTLLIQAIASYTVPVS